MVSNLDVFGPNSDESTWESPRFERFSFMPFGLCRLSTKEQEKNYSLLTQNDAIRNECWRIDPLVYPMLFNDTNQGAIYDTKVWRMILEMLDSYPCTHGFFVHFNRLGRSYEVRLHRTLDLYSRGIALKSLRQGLATTSFSLSEARMFANLPGLNFDDTGARLNENRKTKKALGGYAGGRPLFGQKSKDRELAPARSQLNTLKIVFELEEVHTAQEIANILAANRRKNRSGGRLALSTIRRFLKENVYREMVLEQLGPITSKEAIEMKNGRYKLTEIT